MSASGSGDFMERMTRASHARAERARLRCSEDEMFSRARAVAPAPPFRLSDQGFDLIAEIKRRSPSAGQLAEADLEPTAQAQAYATGGAAALSVLTEPEAFNGSLEDLQAVAAVSPIPVMRKDFLVNPYQVAEARVAGAGGVLLVAAILSDEVLAEMLDCALDLGMFALMEAFDEEELDRCAMEARVASDQRARVLVGVNCRNLRSLEVDFGHFARMAPNLPANVPCVAESGLSETGHVEQVVELGYSLGLVGTALMRSGDPAGRTSTLLKAGRGQAA